ncbi:hypothetical protein PYW07_011146 [Mythimna separata]|uniref:Neurotransmitter-gated ion-channel ligand-binding domain-containing protein n=1 Tax=Mythimna separata TaxID=271217 RepID=A0AAD7Y7T0_MYTSE|nr:hypothetical protein PYW07_011146 [Mythimna separata]
MALFSYIALLAILNITLAEDCVINNVPERMAFEKQLRKDLKCDDDKYWNIPPSNGSALTVDVKFAIKRFTFDSVAGVMTLHTWMSIRWKDERLMWNPENYYGIEKTEMISIRMWNPGFRLFNSVDSNYFDRYFYEWCSVRKNGDVRCVVKVTHNAMCSVKVRDWPYDQQHCSFEFGAWTTKSESFKINFTSRQIVTLEYEEYGGEWAITEYDQELNSSSERQLKMFFTLRREAADVIDDDVKEQIVLEVPEFLDEDPRRYADEEDYGRKREDSDGDIFCSRTFTCV